MLWEGTARASSTPRGKTTSHPPPRPRGTARRAAAAASAAAQRQQPCSVASTPRLLAPEDGEQLPHAPQSIRAAFLSPVKRQLCALSKAAAGCCGLLGMWTPRRCPRPNMHVSELLISLMACADDALCSSGAGTTRGDARLRRRLAAARLEPAAAAAAERPALAARDAAAGVSRELSGSLGAGGDLVTAWIGLCAA